MWLPCYSISGGGRPWLLVVGAIAVVARIATPTSAFYLPGLAPQDYKEGDLVPLHVNSITPSSGDTVRKPESVVSYSFYDSRFHFCQPPGNPQPVNEWLGSILFGDRIFTSAFEIRMLKVENCKLLCASSIPQDDASFVARRISEGYSFNWLLDGLPVAMQRQGERVEDTSYSIGFEMGREDVEAEQGEVGRPSIYNHYDLTVEYHTVDDRHYRVVGVFVTPSSRDTRVEDIEGGKCDAAGPVRIDTAAPETGVVYTYSVKWRASNKSWATRWDNYLNILDPKIHWFNLIVAIIVVVVLSSMVALILTHTLRKDIARYNSDDAEDLQEDLGWKLVHGDVFREPHHKQLLSVLVGSGSQLFCMTLSTIVFALLGFLSPSNRGSLGTAMVVLQMIFGFSAGYNSARLYHTLRGKNLKLNVAATCFFVPGIVLCMLTLLEIFLIAKGSSSAVPFKAFLGVIGLWFLVSVPLTLLGAYFGYRKRPFEHPTRTNQIPRQIPDGPWYFRPVPSAMMGGVLAFMSIFVELYFIMTSIWFHKIYYVFGFLFIVFIILVITCAEVAILVTYFHLCIEDYHWWWRSFFTSGASAFYVMAYSIYFYYTNLHLATFTSAVLYFGWSFVISFLFFILTGTIGFTASYWFVRKIYKSIKID